MTVPVIKRKYVEEAVDALLENKIVAAPRTKAIGCSIKWKNEELKGS